MDNKPQDPRPSLPVANYSSAIARAVDWLGDRYLLAIPINAPRNRGTRGLVHRPGERRA
jgi:hypothetical protein